MMHEVVNKQLLGPRRSTKHHLSEELLRSSPYRYRDIKKVLSLYAKNCEICNDKPAKYICPICNRYVCEEHYSKRHEMCLACLEALCDVCRDTLASSRCTLCGRKVCHNCAIELDEIRRVCYHCLIRHGSDVRKLLRSLESLSM